MIRVLIVDDDKLSRKGLISIVDWADCQIKQHYLIWKLKLLVICPIRFLKKQEKMILIRRF